MKNKLDTFIVDEGRYIVCNPQLITLQWLHSSPVGQQRNPRSHVIVSKHVDKSQWLSLQPFKSQLLNVFKLRKKFHCKLWEPPFFCIYFSSQRKILTISNDDFDILIGFICNETRISRRTLCKVCEWAAGVYTYIIS